MSTNITLSGPGHFVAAVPALLGFHPTDSLVVVFLTRERSEVACTLRIDIPEDLTALVPQLLRVAARAESDTVVTALFCDRGVGDPPRRGEVALLIGLLAAGEVKVKDAFLVDDGRWWSFLCNDSSCCPPDGTPIPQETTEVEAERVAAGLLAVAPTREALQQQYTPRPDLAPSPAAFRAAVRVLDLPARARADSALVAVTELAGMTGTPLVEQTRGWRRRDALRRAQLVMLMHDVHVRDFVLASLATDDTDTTGLVDALVRTALTAPEGLRAPLAATAAAALVATGGDPVAVWSLLGLAPGESLAGLVEASITAGIPPQGIRAAFAEAMPEVEHRLDERSA